MSQSLFLSLIEQEQKRQDHNIELIASENFVSDNVLRAMGSCLTNKYAEGYPGNRYYGGCQIVDEIETLCQQKWLEVFNCGDKYLVNVQPHSGSQANFAAYAAILQPGDTILSMSLNNGGCDNGLPYMVTYMNNNLEYAGNSLSLIHQSVTAIRIGQSAGTSVMARPQRLPIGNLR